MRNLVLCGLVLIGFGASHAEASNRALPKEHLCARAGIVMIGTVESVSSSWTGGGTSIDSSIVFNVERMIHGPSITSITVPVPGGEISGTRLTVGSFPAFAEDERYLLLLHPRPSAPAIIMGFGAGAIRLDASATLPSTADLVDMWEENCDA